MFEAWWLGLEERILIFMTSVEVYNESNNKFTHFRESVQS